MSCVLVTVSFCVNTNMPLFNVDISQVIRESCGHFVVLHMQEIGGKNFEECSDQVPIFVDKVASFMQGMGYSTGRAYLDLEFDQPEFYNVSVVQLHFHTGQRFRYITSP